jgi:magnesium-transporting ATPase (P-type)
MVVRDMYREDIGDSDTVPLLILMKGDTLYSQDRQIHMETGAPEIIIKHCCNYVSDDRSIEITDDFRHDFDSAYTSYGERGRRLIGFAIHHIQVEKTKKWTVEDIPLGELNFLGMVAIMDPPRDDAASAIAQCKVCTGCPHNVLFIYKFSFYIFKFSFLLL